MHTAWAQDHLQVNFNSGFFFKALARLGQHNILLAFCTGVSLPLSFLVKEQSLAHHSCVLVGERFTFTGIKENSVIEAKGCIKNCTEVLRFPYPKQSKTIS